MANIPQELHYTAEHEYIRRTDQDDVVTIGITDYAQGELGDVVFVELPAPGASFETGAAFGTIEAVKAVSELFCPVAGEIVEVNDALDANPDLVNSDPYGEGWMIRLKVRDTSELEGLMDADAYAEHIG